MVFCLDVKEKNKTPKDIIRRDYESKGAGNLFSKVGDQFSDYLIIGNEDEQPFIYESCSSSRFR